MNFRGSEPLGGLIGLSGFESILHSQVEIKKDDARSRTPMFLYHGTDDDIIDVRGASFSYSIVKEMYYTDEHESNF